MRLKILIIILSGFVLINPVIAQELTEESQGIVTKEVKDGTRIVISTSGPAKFSSYWLDNPPRLVVEFQSKNILSKIDNEVIVNQGVIKRITSSYSGKEQNRPLKSLTFELLKKVPYKIWQEDNNIILDIQIPLETPVFRVESKEVSAEETSDAIVKRLEAMDTALTGVTENQAPLEIPETRVDEEAPEEVISPKTEVLPPVEPIKGRKTIIGIVFWFVGLTLISGLGFLVWYIRRLNINKKREKLESELQEKNKRLKQEKIIREAIERASLQREKEYEQLKDSFQSLKDSLLKKELLKKELSPEEKERPRIPGKSQERRANPRLSLTRDFNKTIILRVKSQNKSEIIKSFANNICSEGLCFGTEKEFNEKEPINLRLFFYGDQVPMIKTPARIIWKRAVGPINYYGVLFDLLDEKDKSELNRYIESKIAKG